MAKIVYAEDCIESSDNGEVIINPIQSTSIRHGVLEDVADIDDAVLRAQGHETAMDRQFNWISALGLGFSITNSWVGYLSCFGQNLVYGGPQSCIFGLIAAFFVQWTITTGLSELASAFPSSGGQYHFCYAMVKGPQREFAAFIVGWMSMIAWWIVTCSGLSLAAVTLCGIVQFWYPAFAASQWQIYLIYVAVAIITSRNCRIPGLISTVIPLFAVPRHISWTVQGTLYLSILGCVMFLIVICSMHGETQPASFITETGLGTSGWSDGTAWMLGITNAMYAFGATDGAIHISEEMPQPGRRVPQVMCITVIIGLLTTLPLMIALMFFMTDLEAVTNSTLPSLEIVYQAIRHKAVATFLLTWLWAVYAASIPSQWVSSGRIAWAFARDQGVPFSEYFSVIQPKLGFPVRATLAAFVFACLYGLLYLASTTAFNSIVTSAVLFLNISYAAPQGILLIAGRKETLPPRYLDLGYFGAFTNMFSVAWVLLLVVFICFPPSLPVSVQSMNWTSVVLIGLSVIILGLWFITGKRNFTGPQIDWHMLHEANLVSTRK